jgi:predicted transposase YdaD
MSKEYADYLSSLKNYRDTNNQLQTKFNEGIKKGIKIEEERSNQKLQNKTFEIACGMLNKGIDVKTIIDCTGLTVEEVEKLRN